MKVVFVLLVLCVTAAGQTSTDLRKKYSEPKSETYQIRPDIDLLVTYGKSGRVCTMLIERSSQWLGVYQIADGNKALKWSVIMEIFDELVPEKQRGALQPRTRLDPQTWKYEKVLLSIDDDKENSARALIVMKDGCE